MNMKYIELTMLKSGSKGYQVKVLQRLLNSNLVIDGIFGNETDKCVRNYQKTHKLEVDGIVGYETWNCILTKGSV